MTKRAKLNLAERASLRIKRREEKTFYAHESERWKAKYYKVMFEMLSVIDSIKGDPVFRETLSVLRKIYRENDNQIPVGDKQTRGVDDNSSTLS